MFKLNLKKFNIYSVLAILMLLGGILFYITWGIAYGIGYDIGMYSLTIVLVIPGVIGLILSLMEEEKTN